MMKYLRDNVSFCNLLYLILFEAPEDLRDQIIGTFKNSIDFIKKYTFFDLIAMDEKYSDKLTTLKTILTTAPESYPVFFDTYSRGLHEYGKGGKRLRYALDYFLQFMIQAIEDGYYPYCSIFFLDTKRRILHILDKEKENDFDYGFIDADKLKRLLNKCSSEVSNTFVIDDKKDFIEFLKETSKQLQNKLNIKG